MQGNDQVIAKLNELLAGELTAMDQYFIHSRMYDDWGLQKLFERIDHEFEDEKGHASKLIERILFLGLNHLLAWQEHLYRCLKAYVSPCQVCHLKTKCVRLI